MARQMRASTVPGAAVWIALLLLGRPALAQAPDDSTLAAARQLGQQGVALYEQGDYAAASDKLERAYAVVKVPTLGLWSGRALEKLGRLVEAAQRYREVTLVVLRPDDPEVFRSAHTDAQKAYDALSSRIPQLTIKLQGASADDARVTVDGKPVPSALLGVAVPVDPGEHAVEGRRAADRASQRVTLQEGEKRAVTLAFTAVAVTTPVAASAAETAAAAPAAAAAVSVEPSPPSVLPWVVVGAGSGLVVTGVVFVALAASAASKVENVRDGTPWSAVQHDYDRVPVFSGVGLGLLGAGAAAVTTGLVWGLSGKDHSEHALSVSAGLARVSLRGAF